MFKKRIDYLFNYSSKILKLDTRYFAAAGFYSSIQQIIGIISGLIISYFFGHYISLEIYGEYNFILSILGFLTLVTLPGLDAYLTKSIAQKYNSSFIRSIKFKLLFSLLGSIILLILGLYYFNNNLLRISFFICAAFFPFTAPFQLFNEYFTAKQKFKELAFYISLSSILSAIFLITTILVSPSLTTILIAYFLGIIIPSLIATKKAFNTISTNFKKTDKELIPLGMFNTLLSIIPWSAGYLGQIILGYSFNPDLLAIFSVANKFPMYIHKNLFVFYKPITAKLASQTNKQHLETLKTHSIKLLLWGILLAVPLYILSPYLIKLVFSDKYTESIKYAQLLSLSIIPLPLTWVMIDITVFQNIKKPRFYATTFVSGVKILLFITLIPKFKINAIVFTIILERYLEFLIYLIILYNNSRTYENKTN